MVLFSDACKNYTKNPISSLQLRVSQDRLSQGRWQADAALLSKDVQAKGLEEHPKSCFRGLTRSISDRDLEAKMRILKPAAKQLELMASFPLTLAGLSPVFSSFS